MNWKRGHNNSIDQTYNQKALPTYKFSLRKGGERKGRNSIF